VVACCALPVSALSFPSLTLRTLLSSTCAHRQAHLRLHTGATPFGCPREDCCKEFKWRSSLSSHAVWHQRKDAGEVVRECPSKSPSKRKSRGKKHAVKSAVHPPPANIVLVASKDPPTSPSEAGLAQKCPPPDVAHGPAAALSSTRGTSSRTACAAAVAEDLAPEVGTAASDAEKDETPPPPHPHRREAERQPAPERSHRAAEETLFLPPHALVYAGLEAACDAIGLFTDEDSETCTLSATSDVADDGFDGPGSPMSVGADVFQRGPLPTQDYADPMPFLTSPTLGDPQGRPCHMSGIDAFDLGAYLDR
jgi:hypothetical protein